MSRLRVFALAICAACLASAPVIYAYSNGAPFGVSGGPAGYLINGVGNCTDCHRDAGLGGPGGVQIIGAPRRYRPGGLYDFAVRVFDPELEPPFPSRVGAGFQVSAEGSGEHVGTLLVAWDDDLTQYADSFTDYVTHTDSGFQDSQASWLPDRAYDYFVQWKAPNPVMNAGPVTLFAAGNVANDWNSFNGERYYSDHATLQYAINGDADGDTDRDLYDYAVVQRCFTGEEIGLGDECKFLDANYDEEVSLIDAAAFISALEGPIAAHPAGYVLADAVRGGLLYDKWWVVTGLTPPGDTAADNHPLWPPYYPLDFPNFRTGVETWRCKECHGWDYKGADGAYGSGSHYTGIIGVYGTTKGDRQIFDMLKHSGVQVPNGHSYASVGLTDEDIWDLVKMVREGVVDTDVYINQDKSFDGVWFNGYELYSQSYCASCHDSGVPLGSSPDMPLCEGTAIDFGTNEYVGTVANSNPWELLHKIRFGHPGAPMPALDLLDVGVSEAADIGAYCQTLRQTGPCP